MPEMSETFRGLGDLDELDHQVRLKAFEFLAKQVELHGEVLPRAMLMKGFLHNDMRVPLMGPEGIFKPKLLPEIPISITTVPVVEGSPRPYNDEASSDGLWIYHYRGNNPDHPDNRGLRLAMARKTPLIYFVGIVPGKYLAAWPVFIVGDNRRECTFSVAIDDIHKLTQPGMFKDSQDADSARRQYITVETRRRLHQRSFRERVLRAYQECCAICALRHQELLEAAHILPDAHPEGEPVIPNGIALCKIHHAAYDRHILGIRPDLVIELRTDILNEIDGPMLTYGLQKFHGSSLSVPRKSELRPNPMFLKERYAMFRAA